MTDKLPLDKIDVDMLASGLDDGGWDTEHYLDRATGELFFGAFGEILGADGETIDPEEQDWLRITGEGSGPAYRVMQDFAGALADRRLRERLEQTLHGTGALRRFGDAVHRADAVTLTAWNAYRNARSELRALAWLEDAEVVDQAELAVARAIREAAAAAALREVGGASYGVRLVLVNGMPGAGKSTLAERYRSEHPGVLVVEADALCGWMGGDPADHAEAARVLSLAMVRAHLESGHDVVVPQLVARVDELERFEQVAEEAGAELVHVVVHGGVVESRVPDVALDHLVDHADGLADVLDQRPGTQRVVTRHGDPDAAYRDLLDLLDPDVPA
jgi:predicted kinase